MPNLATRELNELNWFDTHSLSNDEIKSAEQDADLWHKTVNTTVVTCGEILMRQKEQLRGAFIHYCEHRLGITQQKAGLMMRAARTLRRDKDNLLQTSSLPALAKLADADDEQFANALELVQTTKKGKLTVDQAAEIMGHAARIDQDAINKAVQEALEKQRWDEVYKCLKPLACNWIIMSGCVRLHQEGISLTAYMPEFTSSWQWRKPEHWKMMMSWFDEAYTEQNYLLRRANEALEAVGEQPLDDEEYYIRACMILNKIHADRGYTSGWHWGVMDWIAYCLKPVEHFNAMWALHTHEYTDEELEDTWDEENQRWIMSHEQIEYTLPDDWDPEVVPERIINLIDDEIAKAEEWVRANS